MQFIIQLKWDLTITNKKQNNIEELSTKKYYKATNIHKLDDIIRIDNYNTQTIQDEINNAIAIAENPIHTYHSSGLPYYFYNAEKYVLYYFSDKY